MARDALQRGAGLGDSDRLSSQLTANIEIQLTQNEFVFLTMDYLPRLTQ